MKTSLLSIASAVVLFFSAGSLATAAPAAAVAVPHHDSRHHDDRRLSPAEKARLEALRRKQAQRNDRRDDRRDNRYDARHDDRYANYGYPKNHRVTDQERARWEAAHRYDRSRR